MTSIEITTVITASIVFNFIITVAEFSILNEYILLMIVEKGSTVSPKTE